MGESEKYIGEGRLCDKEEDERIANAEKNSGVAQSLLWEVYA